MLTHLSLRTSDTTKSAFNIALGHGVNLQSLQIQGYLGSLKSQHFRHYTHALPSLTEFSIFLHGHLTQPCTDLDFFPAVCDFLCPKAIQIVHLELKALEQKAEQDKLGLNGNKECWALFKGVSQSEVVELFPKQVHDPSEWKEELLLTFFQTHSQTSDKAESIWIPGKIYLLSC